MDIIRQFKTSLSQREILSFSRWGIVLLGLGSLILALILKGVISALLLAYTVYTCGLILPAIAGFYKDRLRLTSTGALAAIVGGGSVALSSRIFDMKYLDLGGLLISGVLLFGVSFIDNRMKKHFA
jgi:SSS family solute:Na+ symporter